MQWNSIGRNFCKLGLGLTLLLGAGCGGPAEGDDVTGQRSDSIGNREGDGVILEFGKPPATGNEQNVDKPPATGNEQNADKPPATGNDQNAGKPPATGNEQNAGNEQNGVAPPEESDSTGAIIPAPPVADPNLTAGMTAASSKAEVDQKLQECNKQRRAGHWYQDWDAKYWYECCPVGYKAEKLPSDVRFRCKPQANTPVPPVNPPPVNPPPVNPPPGTSITAGMTSVGSRVEADQKIQECAVLKRIGHSYQDTAGKFWYECCALGQKVEKLPGEVRFYCKAM